MPATEIDMPSSYSSPVVQTVTYWLLTRGNDKDACRVTISFLLPMLWNNETNSLVWQTVYL